MRSVLLTIVSVLISGCHAYQGPVNPSFPVTEAEAMKDERRMRADLKPLDRPVVVIGAYRSPDPVIDAMTITLSRMTSGERGDFVRVPTWFEGDIEDLAALTIEKIERAHPSGSEAETIEVDVVGQSMGGLVARYAADRIEGRRLKIRRLITLATPHRGAVMAERAALVEDRAIVDMYRRSLFLTKLEEAYSGDYEIIPYARLKDGVVHAIDAAPPGRWPIWVSGPRFGGSHFTIEEDRRILCDVARRLRGEEPRGLEGEPLPASELGRRPG